MNKSNCVMKLEKSNFLWFIVLITDIIFVFTSLSNERC